MELILLVLCQLPCVWIWITVAVKQLISDVALSPAGDIRENESENKECELDRPFHGKLNKRSDLGS
jgi:hypothetical protein